MSCAFLPPVPIPVLCQTYVVQSGDSLSSVAAKFGVNSDELAVSMSECVGYQPGAVLQVGQKICLTGYVPACDSVIDSGNIPTCKAYKVQQVGAGAGGHRLGVCCSKSWAADGWLGLALSQLRHRFPTPTTNQSTCLPFPACFPCCRVTPSPASRQPLGSSCR